MWQNNNFSCTQCIRERIMIVKKLILIFGWIKMFSPPSDHEKCFLECPLSVTMCGCASH
jgi:hypothetical protein